MPSYGPPPSNIDPDKVAVAFITLALIVAGLVVWVIVLTLR